MCRDIGKRLHFLCFGSDLWSWMLCEGVKCLLDVEIPGSETWTLLSFSYQSFCKKGVVKATYNLENLKLKSRIGIVS